jgi:hypothetical protein
MSLCSKFMNYKSHYNDLITGQPVTVIPPPVVLTPTVVGQPMTAQVNSPQDALRRAQEQAQVRQSPRNGSS